MLKKISENIPYALIPAHLRLNQYAHTFTKLALRRLYWGERARYSCQLSPAQLGCLRLISNEDSLVLLRGLSAGPAHLSENRAAYEGMLASAIYRHLMQMGIHIRHRLKVGLEKEELQAPTMAKQIALAYLEEDFLREHWRFWFITRRQSFDRIVSDFTSLVFHQPKCLLASYAKGVQSAIIEAAKELS